jgi:hypothetical protein
MKRFLRSKLTLSLTALVILAGAILIPSLRSHTIVAHAATATVTDIPNPDSYTCAQSGFITFENMADGTNLSANAINGVHFTTTNGYTWLVGDFATGNYNGKYPNGGYTSEGTHWAWLGPNQGAGRIDFVNGPASYFSLLTSDNNTPVEVDAYKADGTLLAIAGPAALNYNTGHMSELKITRDTADINYVIVHDTGNFFLVDSICTNASGVPNQAVSDFKQNVDPWQSHTLGNRNDCPTIGAVGCALTATADVLASYGYKTLPNGGTLDPGNLNDYIGSQGFDADCDIYWGAAARAVGLGDPVILFARWPNGSQRTTWAQRQKEIDDALKNGDLPIVSVKGEGHWIVLYQAITDASGNSVDYRILDPFLYRSGNWSGRTLSETYGSLQSLSATMDVVHFIDKSHPARTFILVGHSPVEFLITDPNGVQTGLNGSPGNYIENIPGSMYGLEPGLADDQGVLQRLPDSIYFQTINPINGAYKVQVIGTGSGPYTLDFLEEDASGITTEQRITGTAALGVTDTYIITISSTLGQPATIQRQVQIDIKPGEDPAAINPGSKGVIPVAILSTPTFDATTVDPKSVMFGPNGAIPVHTSIEDVNGDGIPDLIFQFNTIQTGIAAGNTQACLTGKTTSGLNIVGCDTIQIVPPRS